MSGGTVTTCAWCGLTAHAMVDEDKSAEFLPEGWDLCDGEELCTGCVLTRRLALERAKSDRKDANKGKGVAS